MLLEEFTQETTLPLLMPFFCFSLSLLFPLKPIVLFPQLEVKKIVICINYEKHRVVVALSLIHQ